MQIKVFVVSVKGDGIKGVKLTHEAARTLAKRYGGSQVEKFFADKVKLVSLDPDKSDLVK